MAGQKEQEVAPREIVLSDADKERMKGIKIYEHGDELVIRIKKDGDFGLSKSEKTTVVASTGGNVRLTGGLMIGINVNKKK